MKQLSEVIHYYIPHKVKCKILNHKCDYVGIEESTVTGYYSLADQLHITYEGGSAGKSINKEIEIFLRPLSDLTKEIEHNGEKFVPIDELTVKNDFVLWGINEFHGDFIKEYDPVFSVLEKLFEWHFDVFGLLESNQAKPIER